MNLDNVDVLYLEDSNVHRLVLKIEPQLCFLSKTFPIFKGDCIYFCRRYQEGVNCFIEKAGDCPLLILMIHAMSKSIGEQMKHHRS